MVALVTPFYQNKVDIPALQGLVEWHCQQGTQGIIICGSTGEGNLLTDHERDHVIETAVKTSANRLPIVVGCGSPSTAQAIAMAKRAEELGADAVLVVSPYYVKPSQDGLYQHFLSLHDAIGLPVILYNNPGRCVVDISLDLIYQLAELPRVVALKDSTMDLSRSTVLRQRLGNRLSLLSGDDPFSAAYLAQGGDGCISITANVVPALCQQLYQAWVQRDIPLFQSLNQKLMPLHLALVAETNPCPVKYAVSALGKIRHEVRLPLLPIQSETKQRVDHNLKLLGLI